MATEVKIPKLGLTMQEGTIASWDVPDGGTVAVGERVYTLETDKVETEIEAEAPGVLRHLVPAGSTLEPGTTIGWILAEGEAAPAATPLAGSPAAAAPTSRPSPAPVPAPPGPASANGRLRASPNAKRVAREMGVDLAAVTGTGPGGRIVSEDVEAAASAPAPVAAAPASVGAAPVSPILRRLAEERSVDLSTLAGSGPGGRVVRADIEAASAAPAAAATPIGPSAGERIPLSGMRGTIARRMHESLQEMAQLTLTTDVDAGPMVSFREQLKADWGGAGLAVPGYTDMILKATALALREHPLLNARVGHDEVELLTEINVGLAVALDGGLIVPVVHGADSEPLDRLSEETTRLAAAARGSSLTHADLDGGTFSVSPLGMLGIDAFTPVVNPPNVAILGVGRIRDEVGVAADGSFEAVKRMTLSLTIDHRAVDGAPGARFLLTVGELLAAPLRLLTT